MNKWMLLLLILKVSMVRAEAIIKRNNIFKDKTTIENPFELRDPFRPPVFRSERKQGRQDKASLRDGTYTNISNIGDIDIDKMRIVGVMVGKERRALARLDGKAEVFVLREGMRLGKDNAELKAIHPGGIIFVEKLVNVYGEEEYLETVIPISQ
jgi:type IV pilus assembly protein PilP